MSEGGCKSRGVVKKKEERKEKKEKKKVVGVVAVARSFFLLFSVRKSSPQVPLPSWQLSHFSYPLVS